MRRLSALLFSILFAVNSVIGLAVPILPVIKPELGYTSQAGNQQKVFTKISHSDKSYKTDYLIDDDQDDQDDNESDEVYHSTMIHQSLTYYRKVELQHYFRPAACVHYDGQPKKFILHCSLKIAC